jgi:hypothetical protein
VQFGYTLDDRRGKPLQPHSEKETQFISAVSSCLIHTVLVAQRR